MKQKNLWVILAILIIPVVAYYMAGPRTDKVTYSGFASAACPVVYDFSSQMCLECKNLKAVITPLEEDYKNKITFYNVDVNSSDPDNQKLVKKYKVNVVPTLVFIDKNGKVVRRTEGSMPKAELKKYLDELSNG